MMWSQPRVEKNGIKMNGRQEKLQIMKWVKIRWQRETKLHWYLNGLSKWIY